MGRRDIPDLIRYRLRDGPHAGEPTSERGEIEQLARECRAGACHAGLDSVVVETRFNVVRSGVPDVVETARRLRDYLPPVDRHDSPMRVEALIGEAAMTVVVWSRGGHGPSPAPRPR